MVTWTRARLKASDTPAMKISALALAPRKDKEEERLMQKLFDDIVPNLVPAEFLLYQQANIVVKPDWQRIQNVGLPHAYLKHVRRCYLNVFWAALAGNFNPRYNHLNLVFCFAYIKVLQDVLGCVRARPHFAPLVCSNPNTDLSWPMNSTASSNGLRVVFLFAKQEMYGNVSIMFDSFAVHRI